MKQNADDRAEKMNYAKKLHATASYHLLFDENENRLRKSPYAICFGVKTRAIKSYCFASTCGIIIICLSFMSIVMYSWPSVFWTKTDLLSGWDTALLSYASNSTFVQPSQNAKTESYILDTSGCKIDDILPFDKRFPEIKEAFHAPKIPQCVTTRNNLTILDPRTHILRVNQDVRKQYYQNVAECNSRTFSWSRDDKNNVVWGKKIRVDLDGDNQIHDDFVWVECKSVSGELVYANAHTQVVKKSINVQGLHLDDKKDDRLNVILLGIDSISRLNFLRHCPEVHEYITKSLGSIALEGFNKVADNTLANMYPLARGKTLMSDWKSLFFLHFDNLDWIWRDFAKIGYATAIAEEMIGLYHPTVIPKGFKNMPSDHYHRPARLVTNSLTEAVPSHKTKLEHKLCHGSLNRNEELIDWTEAFVNTYKNKNFMSFTFISNATHWELNDIGRFKHKLLSFYKNLETSGALNNTMVILLADHGFRMGGKFFESYVGAYEARLPMVYLTLPKWFSAKYPKAYKNLQTNAHRLTTFYDLHQTLHDVCENKFPRENQETTVFEYGTSLFGPIPESRTCSQAGIESHWCACGSYEDISLEDQRAQQAGRILFDAVRRYNKINITDNQCVDFTTFSLTEAKVKVHGSADGKSMVAKQEISLSIKVQPRDAQFRSTIAIDKGRMPTLGPIERLDNYGSQSTCLRLKNPVIEVTCICKNWKPAENTN